MIKSIIKEHSISKIIILNCLSSVNKLDGIKAQKDVLSHESKKNIGYKINCKNCNTSYVEQTSRKLKTRINELRIKNDLIKMN